MTEKIQRDVFLLLTIVGSFLCLAFIALGGFYVFDDWRSISSEIAAGNGSALLGRAQRHLPVSLFGGSVLVGTWFSYRRYHKLTFRS